MNVACFAQNLSQIWMESHASRVAMTNFMSSVLSDGKKSNLSVHFVTSKFERPN